MQMHPGVQQTGLVDKSADHRSSSPENHKRCYSFTKIVDVEVEAR
jgi:hypothetical protein